MHGLRSQTRVEEAKPAEYVQTWCHLFVKYCFLCWTFSIQSALGEAGRRLLDEEAVDGLVSLIKLLNLNMKTLNLF